MSTVSSWRFGAFELDWVDRRLFRDGKAVALPPKAFDILTILVRNAGRLVRRDDLFEAVWRDVDVEDANLTNNIAALRRLLGRNSIVSVPRHGYRFCLPVSATAGLPPEAISLFSEAQNLLSQRSKEYVLRSRDLLWLVIGHQPQYAAAWAWLGRGCRFLEKFGVEREYHRKMVDLAFQQAFAIDSELACAHQFFTVVQVDRGEALSALSRLLTVPEGAATDPHYFAALVQVCRFCGLPEASIRAHQRAQEIDPGIATSVPHTYFASCEYEAVVESYLACGHGTRIYLDLCAWACLGFKTRAETEALNRLQSREWPPLFKTLLKSFLHALRGEADEVRRLCLAEDIYEDPESALYLARHLAFSGCNHEALTFLRNAISGGLAVPQMLENDPWFEGLRSCSEFERLVGDSLVLQSQAERTLKSSRASRILVGSNEFEGAKIQGAMRGERFFYAK